MKAIVQEKYGSPDELKLREVDKPMAGDDDVLVQVRAASVHPDVWHMVSGRAIQTEPSDPRYGYGRSRPVRRQEREAVPTRGRGLRRNLCGQPTAPEAA